MKNLKRRMIYCIKFYLFDYHNNHELYFNRINQLKTNYQNIVNKPNKK